MHSFALQAKELTWSVDQVDIIQQINLQIKTGETVAIVGPNGAGKTSLLKCLFGEYHTYKGDVYLNGKALSTLHKKEIAQHIAVVSQHADSAFNLTVLDIVSMGLIPHKGLFDLNTDEDRTNIQQALIKVDLLNKQHQQFNTLSGGEQQRVLIARAVVQSANILIMDEPTNHLDMYYQHQILQLAKKLDITLVLTIHDLNLAAQYCDRIVMLNHGKIVADDNPEKVLKPELLSKIFKLDCIVDENPFTQRPRVTFAGTNSKSPSERNNTFGEEHHE